ncbi:MAG: PEP-CTERM sorting domain-containing protein [Coleofasciculaceae cyanobacterium]
MKNKSVSSLLGTFGLVCGCLFAMGQPAKADINYGIDSFKDGFGFGVVGSNSPYEFYGMAIIEDGNNLIVALNTNMPLSGAVPPSGYTAQGGVVAFGDLFFNFSQKDFDSASNDGSLFGIRFTPANDSGVSTLGLYSNVTAKSVTSTNIGFANLNAYNDKVKGVGGTPSLAQLPVDTSYFNQNSPVLNVIDTGNFVTSINMLSSAQISDFGFDFAQFGATGSQTIGFSFDKTALPAGDFLANIFAECANDGMVIAGKLENSSEPVPEPLTILGSIAGVGLILRRQRSKGKQSIS